MVIIYLPVRETNNFCGGVPGRNKRFMVKLQEKYAEDNDSVKKNE
jgi:hypothetical protein